jgi:hypothetical protein
MATHPRLHVPANRPCGEIYLNEEYVSVRKYIENTILRYKFKLIILNIEDIRFKITRDIHF